jgi:hypothetical protein
MTPDMILIHRLTPFGIGLIASLGFASLLNEWIHPMASFGFAIFFIILLYARLLHWRVRTFQFWHFLGTPVLYLISAFGMIFLFEQSVSSLVLAIASVLFLMLFAEYIFQYTHLPSQYQPYSIEYLTLLLNVLTIFFLSSVAYGVHLLIQAPLLLLSSCFFLLSLFILYGTLWVSKADDARSRPYALAGSILTTEFFVAFAFLPSGLYTNAALITLFFYLFLGLTRAQVHHKLSATVVKRYVGVAVILLIVILLSTDWL